MISAYSKLEHNALHNIAQEDVARDDDLRFRLRMGNADNHIENINQSHDRTRKLEAEGGFKTLNQPLSFKRRTIIPNWSAYVHEIDTVGEGSTVCTTKGQAFDARLVLPVATGSTKPQTFTHVSEPRDDRRRVLSRE